MLGSSPAPRSSNAEAPGGRGRRCFLPRAHKAPVHENELAWFWATCPSAAHRDSARAVEYATRVCEETQWKNGNFLDTLAAACAEAGDCAHAVEWQQKANALFTFTDEQEKHKAEERLALYKEGKPYRE